MGAGINRDDNENSTNKSTTSTTSGSSTDTTGGRTTDTTGGRTTDTTGGRTTDTTGGKGNKKIPKVVAVDVPNESEEEKRKREERNAKRREAYQRNKEKNKTTTTKARTKKQSNPADDLLNENQLIILLMTISNVLATREGMEHWKLTQAECENIALPLSKIIKDSMQSDTAIKYGNHIALLVAIVSIVIPRAVVSIQIHKVRKESKNVIKLRNDRREKSDKTGKVINFNNKDNGKTSDNGKNDDSVISDVLAGIGE